MELFRLTQADNQAKVRLRFAQAGTGSWYFGCLLYTSDAADERSSVDLGGRRIIKKKKYARQQQQKMNRSAITAVDGEQQRTNKH